MVWCMPDFVLCLRLFVREGELGSFNLVFAGEVKHL